MEIYTVRSGDSLWAVSRRFGSTVEKLAYINQLTDPSRLVPGMSLVIPTGSRPAESMEINGYAYPNISNAALDEALPYLSYLSPFSYNASADGYLSELYDTRLLDAAAQSGTAALMNVTNMGDSGGFSGSIAHSLLTDQRSQDRLLESIFAVLREKNYYGVNFDFEYVFPYDKGSYSQFLGRASAELHSRGYFLSSAVAPKVSDNQQGLLYAAHDYAAHGRYCDRVIIMTYEWGYTYSAPQAVSPVDRMRQVLDYAVTRIDPGKILLGFSNYGYRWQLPWRQGQAAQVISNVAAANLAASVGASVAFDSKAQAPYFRYTDAAGQRREVWYEDGRSVRSRLQLVSEYGLAGISLWTLNQLNRPMLEVIGGTYIGEKLI